MTRDKETVEALIETYIKDIYAFLVKKTKNLQDAEDLSQDLGLKIYKTLMSDRVIEKVDKYIWSMVHNGLKNYYRQNQVSLVGIHQVPQDLSTGDLGPDQTLIKSESEKKIHQAIAYLSKTQRRVLILYYYENKRQKDIARHLGIPLNTVKWHLGEAKSLLRKDMVKMKDQYLKFNPIEFDRLWMIGALGRAGGPDKILRSSLAQNIIYLTWQEGKTIHQMADLLNVSPVFIEDEVDFLLNHGYLSQDKKTYLSQVMIEALDIDKLETYDEVCRQAGQLLAGDLYDRLVASGLLDHPDLQGPKDHNFRAWSLIAYILGHSSEAGVSFNDLTSIRPDGGQYIACASLQIASGPLPRVYTDLQETVGPLWNQKNGLKIWELISPWNGREIDLEAYSGQIAYDLDLLNGYLQGRDLSPEASALVIKKAYMGLEGGELILNVVRIASQDLHNALVDLGLQVRAKHKERLEDLRQDYRRLALKRVPKRLHLVHEFMFSNLFSTDGVFINHCYESLLSSGRLRTLEDKSKASLLRVLVGEGETC